MGAIAAVLSIALPAVVFAAGGDGLSSIYFAPADRVSFKEVIPREEPRRFTFVDSACPDRMFSDDGWEATFGKDGQVKVVSPAGSGLDISYVFDRGRLVEWKGWGTEGRIPYETPRSAPDGVLTPLAFFKFTPEYLKERDARVLEGKWNGSGRLCFPYQNPNHSSALFCHLTLLAFSLFLFLRRSAWRIVALSAAATAGACLAATGSRGGMLGLAVGLIPFAATRFRTMSRSKAFWISLVGCVASVIVWFTLSGHGNLTRGFAGGGLDWGNAVRVDMMKVASRMMVDAPGGWDFVGAGRAYFDWYQPIENMFMTGSLMNDHLTVMANMGWTGRLLYLFAVATLLLLSFVYLKRGGELAAAVFVATAVMACFNPIFREWGLWCVPLVAALALVYGIAHTRAVGSVLRCVVCGAVLALVACGVLLLSGTSGHREHIEACDGQVRYRSLSPRVWIVDDQQGALGGIFACRDIREFYRYHPDAPGVGYVRDISNLPKGGFDKLVLSGKAANDWLSLLSENEEARKHLPKEVVLVSPPFAPSEIPSALLHFCRVRVLVGEFAARFQREYENPPKFVEVVPGLERYMLRWMERVVGE